MNDIEKIKLLRYLDYRSVGKEKNNKLNVSLPVDLEEKLKEAQSAVSYTHLTLPTKA